jgi:hypothetical protein
MASGHHQRNEEKRFGLLLPRTWGVSTIVGSKWVLFHMIFDIKEDLTRRAHFVAGSHVTNTPIQLTYSSVVTRESVRIAFLITAVNNLQILSADIA